jgi:arginyl-tRNA synthetase
MTFRLLVNEIREAVSFALANLGYSDQDFDISETPRKEYGDLSCNVAFQIGKKIKKQPFEIAKEIFEKQLNPYLLEKKRKNSLSLILSIEPHSSGYINFKVNFANLATTTLMEVLENPNYGFYDIGKSRCVVVEHTSVNPNKALHVGHMRNVIIGDTIYRIMKATNHKTLVLNYIDDSGLQVADIVVGFKFAGFPLEPPNKSAKFDHYCGDEVYVKINELYKKDPSLEEKRRSVLREIEEGKSEIAEFAAEITMRVLNEQLKTCWRMKTHYDLLNFESHIITSNLWIKSFELLKSKGIVTLETSGKNKGCWVIKQEQEDDKVLIRSDGTATYIAKDIPYAAWKLGIVKDPFFYYKFVDQWDNSALWATTLIPACSQDNHPEFNPARIAITIIDSRQARLQRMISKIMADLNEKRNEYYHLSYEAITLSSETAKMIGLDIGEKKSIQMSGRKGIQVNADYVLDTLHAKAYEEVKQRNPNLCEETSNKIAEQIAISAIRYNLIKQDLDKVITFDIIESLRLEGDTGPYLQYAYARSQRILEKSAQNFSKAKYDLLIAESELDLIKAIAKFDIIIEEAVRTLNPKSLARYAYTLATYFNIFYEKIPVLKEQSEEIMSARLALVKAFGQILKSIFNILGITPLTKM